MASFDLKITPAGQKLVNRLAAAGKIDFRPTLNVIGIGYRKEVEAIFNKQQPRAAGLRWPPLFPRYKRWKDKHYPGAPILVRTGALKRSMITVGAKGNITAISNTKATFGTSIRYAIYHDSLENPGRKNPPMRNFSDPSERRLKIWEDQISKDIRHNLAKEGIKIEGDVLA